MNKPLIPLYKANISKDEFGAVERVCENGILSRGKEIESFEVELSRYLNKKYVVCVSSGSAALDLAIKSLDFIPGQSILTTPFSYIATGNVIISNDLVPVFFDINSDTLNLDLDKLPKQLKKIDGALLVHIMAKEGNYKKINHFGIPKEKIIEDCSQNLVTGKQQKSEVGKIGTISVYSFHEGKIITTGGEGGAIATNSKKVADRCYALRDQGRLADKNWKRKIKLGYNYRMTEIQAAFGRAQLKKIDHFKKEKMKIAMGYKDGLQCIRNIVLPDQKNIGNCFVYNILVKDIEEKSALMKILENYGIESGGNFFPPLNGLPEFKKFGYSSDVLPVSKNVYERLIALPLYPGLDVVSVNRICQVINSYFRVKDNEQ